MTTVRPANTPVPDRSTASHATAAPLAANPSTVRAPGAAYPDHSTVGPGPVSGGGQRPTKGPASPAQSQADNQQQ